MSRLFLKHGKFAIVSVLFYSSKIANFHSHSRYECVKGYRLRKPRSSSWLTSLWGNHAVRLSADLTVSFIVSLFFFFFFCRMSFSHTHHIACIGLPPLIQTWKAVANSRRVQRQLLLLQGNSYKTFQSQYGRKWFPKSHNSVDVPQCRTLIVWYANLVMSNGFKSCNSSFAKTGKVFIIRHLLFVFYYLPRCRYIVC